jgi:hypothetical protein
MLGPALVLMVLLAPVEQVAACSCAGFGPEEAARAADAVFAGTVVADRPIGAEPGRPFAATVPFPDQFGQRMYTFAVDGVAKGEVASAVDVLAGGDGASCGMSFGMDERWLVFTTFDGATHTTGLCSGNMPLEAGADSPLPLTAPEAIPEPASASVEVPLPAIALLAIVALVLAVSWVAFARDRPS